MKGNETIAKVKQNIARIWHLWYMKYVLVCVVGILIVGFLDDNSVLSHFNIAREQYFMKADDEDIFVLSDDEVEQKEGVVPNENAE